MLRPDPVGLFDIFSATLVLFTSSFLPETFLNFHIAVLYFKGLTTIIEPVRLPMPFFYIFSMADVLSGAIIFTGEPAFLTDYKNWIAGILFLKGFMGFPRLLKLAS